MDRQHLENEIRRLLEEAGLDRLVASTAHAGDGTAAALRTFVDGLVERLADPPEEEHPALSEPWEVRNLGDGTGRALLGVEGIDEPIGVLPRVVAERAAFLQEASLHVGTVLCIKGSRTCPLCGGMARYGEPIKHEGHCAYAQADLMRSMPMPRLQLRWSENRADRDGYPWICHYEFVLPLRPNDVRNEDKLGFMVVRLGYTRSGGAEPTDAPYRDGAHALWDAEALGGSLPVWLIMQDGSARPFTTR